MPSAKNTSKICLCLLACICSAAFVCAAPPGHPTQNRNQMVELNLPADVEVSVLADFIANRLGINILYDNSVKNKKITIISPSEVPVDSLLGLLESVLKASGLMLIDTEQAGWKKIVPDKDMLKETDNIKIDTESLDELGPTVPLTQVYTLQHISADEASKIVKAFLGKPGGNCFTIDNTDMLVITDRRSRVQMLIEILKLADKPARETSIQFVAVEHTNAEQLAKQVSQLLSQKNKLASGSNKRAQLDVVLQADKRSNQIMVLATVDSAASAIELIKQLDVPEYSPPSPIRFYKLVNTTASEVLSTIKSLAISDYGASAVTFEDVTAKSIPKTTTEAEQSDTNEKPDTPAKSDAATEQDKATEVNDSVVVTVKTPKASVTADTNTNTIIVIAAPAMQDIYAKLITMLDKRRPQVMIEATMVSLDTSDNFSFGVEVGGFGTKGSARQLIFSSFGLSEIVTDDDAQMNISPGLGFNGTVLDAGDYSAVVRALQTNGNSKVISAPRVLVNDNATSTFSSVSEAPYTSVNASDTVATTSFAGYASAGTELTVTPHISEGEHLQLKYSLSLKSFSGEGSDDIPPPRQSNEIDSEVTIPNGHAVIIGGLKRIDSSHTESSLPWLGKIPLLKYLFGNRTSGNSESTLFVFIRPVILRDDIFADLKAISSTSLADAGLPANKETNKNIPQTEIPGPVMLME